MKISNPTEEIKKALPELEDVSGNIKTVTIENWERRVRTIQTKIKKKYKKYSWLNTYQMYLNPCIIEYMDGKLIKFDEDKYKIIRKYLLSDEFNL